MLIAKALSLTDVSAQLLSGPSGLPPSRKRTDFLGQLDPKFFEERVWIYREPYFAMITFVKYTDSIEHRMHEVTLLNEELRKEIELTNLKCEIMLKQVRELNSAQAEKINELVHEKEVYHQHYLRLAEENYSLKSELEKARKPFINIDLHRLDRLTSIALIVQGAALAGVLWTTILISQSY